MLRRIKYILFCLKQVELSNEDIRFWRDSYDVEKLEYALENGNYNTRQYAAEALELVGNESSIPILLKFVNDPIHKVSIAVLNALETLKKDRQLQILINKKRLKWVRHIAKKQTNKNSTQKKKSNIYRWERSTKKSFEMVKERLKRPIR